jgi:DeoR family transcriptional regulator, fructose operon transcriptional repressor
MFGLERLQAIRELITEKKSVEVTYLSQALEVSEVTIRRDLDKLEKEGFIVKTYGGAILIEETGINQSAINEMQSLHFEKELLPDNELGKTAVKLIEEGDTVFISGSAIGEALARQLAVVKNLIVVTNNLLIATYLFREGSHKVIMLGGLVDPVTGNVTEYEQLSDLLIEKAFLTIDGVDLATGYTVNEKGAVTLYKTLKSVSRTLIVLADSSMYSKRGLFKMAQIQEVSIVVTDKHIPDDFKSFYYENNVKVYSSMLS